MWIFWRCSLFILLWFMLFATWPIKPDSCLPIYCIASFDLIPTESEENKFALWKRIYSGEEKFYFRYMLHFVTHFLIYLARTVAIYQPLLEKNIHVENIVLLFTTTEMRALRPRCEPLRELWIMDTHQRWIRGYYCNSILVRSSVCFWHCFCLKQKTNCGVRIFES